MAGEWIPLDCNLGTMLFAGDDDYRRRGLGIEPKRTARATA